MCIPAVVELRGLFAWLLKTYCPEEQRWPAEPFLTHLEAICGTGVGWLPQKGWPTLVNTQANFCSHKPCHLMVAFTAWRLETLSIPRPVTTWLVVGVGKGREGVWFDLREPKVKLSWWKNRALGWRRVGRDVGVGGTGEGKSWAHQASESLSGTRDFNCYTAIIPSLPPNFDPSRNEPAVCTERLFHSEILAFL